MTHYEKLATMLLKTVGFLSVIYGFLGCGTSAIPLVLQSSNPFQDMIPGLLHQLYYINFFIFGVITLLASGTISSAVSRFSEEDE